MRLRRRGANRVDAAFAILAEDVEADLTGPDLGQVAEDVPLAEGLLVQKTGRTTGLTQGEVTASELDDVAVEYGIGTLMFYGAFEVRGSHGPFSSGGDSGSVVVGVHDGAGYGLLFAGTEGGNPLTYCNSLAEVLTELDTRPLAEGGAR